MRHFRHLRSSVFCRVDEFLFVQTLAFLPFILYIHKNLYKTGKKKNKSI